MRRRTYIGILILLIAVGIFVVDRCGRDQVKGIFPHIRTYASIYHPPSPDATAWYQAHIDMGGFLDEISEEVTSTNLRYVNWSDQDQMEPLYGELLQFCRERERDLNDVFLHYAKDMEIPRSRVSITERQTTMLNTAREDKFFRVFRTGNADSEEYVDLTHTAYGDAEVASYPVTHNLVLFENLQSALLIGHPWPFTEIHLNFQKDSNRSGSWVLEYWDGQKWAEIHHIKNRLQEHQIFTPPNNWQMRSVKGFTLFWVRLRATRAGKIILQSICRKNEFYEWRGTSALRGRRYAQKGDQMIVPGWNPANDLDGNGYVDDREFQNRPDRKASARFKHQAIVPSRYLSNRWVTWYGSDVYQDFIREKTAEKMDESLFAGLFWDNTHGYVPDNFIGRAAYLEFAGVPMHPNKVYEGHAINMARLLKKSLDDKLLIANGAWLWPDFMEELDGSMLESHISYQTSLKEGEKELRDFEELVNYYGEREKILIHHGNNDPGTVGNASMSVEQDAMHALARYYLTAGPNTLFKYQRSSDYTKAKEDWFRAIEYNIGRPKGELFIFYRKENQTIYGRKYEKALVLLRPASEKGELTVKLPFPHQSLTYKGKLDPSIESITMHPFEGKILIR